MDKYYFYFLHDEFIFIKFIIIFYLIINDYILEYMFIYILIKNV